MSEPISDTLSDLELMNIHVEMSYTHSETGFLSYVNDGLRGQAPRFWFGSTRDGNIWRFRHDVDAALREQLDDLCHAEPHFKSGLASALRQKEEFSQRLGSLDQTYAGPSYWFAKPALAPDNTVPLSRENQHLLGTELKDWTDAVGKVPAALAVEGDIAASICASSLVTKRAHAAGLETAPSFRRQGHALRAAAGWARMIQQQGALAFYGTTFDNVGSQQVAKRLGLHQFGVEFYF